MSIQNIGDMKECDHAEYRRIYDKYKDRLTVFSSYSGGILGMPEMSTAWGIKGNETALIASECENWERSREDPAAWTYWKNSDLVESLDARDAMMAALEAVEWIDGQPYYDGEYVTFCPECLNEKHEGHTAECLIGNAIRKARGEK